MVTMVSIKKLKIHTKIYPEDEIARYLNRFASNTQFIDTLVNYISPVKVVEYKRKLYPIEHLDELSWLCANFPSTQMTIFTVETVKSIASVEQHIYIRHILKHLSSINNKDLHGFEQQWKVQSNGNYSQLLSQKQWAKLLNCERSLLLRHRKQIQKQQPLIEKDTSPSHFTWEKVTQQIPSNGAIE